MTLIDQIIAVVVAITALLGALAAVLMALRDLIHPTERTRRRKKRA